MALNALVDRVRQQWQRWMGHPAPQVIEAPAAPKRTMAEVELPPVIALTKGKRYHAPNCGFVQGARSQVIPFKTREEAYQHGLAPCNVCQPSVN